MSNTPEINVQRRRKGEKPTERAEAPSRRRTGSSAGGGSIFTPTKGKVGGCGGVLLLVIIVVITLLTSNGDNTGSDQSDSDQSQYDTYQEPTEIRATRTPRPTTSTSANASAEQKWLVMVYQDADNQTLEQDIYLDLNELERVGSTDDVKIVSQIDRFRGGYQGDGDWRSTRRYLITQDDDLNTLGSDMIDDMGELNMADGGTLVDFVVWAMETYPSNHYALILSDHGMGWIGGWSDPAPGATDPGTAPLISMSEEDQIYLAELGDALELIQGETGVEKLDLIGLDACLMSQLEVYTALQPYTHFAVASEETEPGLGWAYTAFMQVLVADPNMDGAGLAEAIVDTYIVEDQRIVDDQARSEFARQGSILSSFFGGNTVSAGQVASELERNITLTAAELDNLPALNDSFNELAYAMQSIDQNLVANARSYAQSYTSVFGSQVQPSYIDLGHFVQLLMKQTSNSTVQNAASAVLEDLNKVVFKERHGKSKPGSTGISIYFPNSKLYGSAYTGMQSYTDLAEVFAQESLWDDFLVYHYSNRSFKADSVGAAIPSDTGVTRAPGLGDITLSSIDASASSIAIGDSVKLSVEITGENIGYIYLFTGLYDSSSNSIYVADTDYLESSNTQSTNGVYYPVWPESDTFIMNFEWEPVLFSISDGENNSVALFNPTVYGASAEDAVYMVQGTYTFAASGEERTAQLYFKDGKLFQVYGFYGNNTASSPSEIQPESGDTFTISDKWLELGSSGGISQVVYTDGDTLTFGDSAFTWKQVYAPAGEYLVGFLISDLDGNIKEVYTKITVE